MSIKDYNTKFPGNILINSKLSSGKSILELSEFDNTALWWYVDIEFYYVFQSVVDGNENTIIQRSNVGKLLAVVSRTIRRLTLVFKYLLKFFCKLTILYINPKKSDIEKPKIIFTGYDIEWRHILNEKGELVKSDQFFDKIIKIIQKQDDYSLLSICPLSFHLDKSYPIFIDKLLHWEVRQIPFDMYYSFACYKKQNAASCHFKKVWEMIENDPAFEQLLKKCVNNNSVYLRQFLKKQFTETFPKSVAQIRIAMNLIKKERPALILLVNEYGDYERALTVAAKRCDIPTFAIQHGVVDPTAPAYIHERLERNSNLIGLECPKPTKTAVYGVFEKEMLITHSNYSDDEVVVTGAHRYDSYVKLNSIYSKKDFCEKFGLETKNKIILWTTQCHVLSNDENDKNFNAVFLVISQLNDTVLIVKQHPGEPKKYRDLIDKIKQSYQIPIIILPGHYDMTELLYVCDLLITKHSMTGLEAIALNKPVIVLNLGKFPEVGDYVKEGVASAIYNKEDLKPTIEQLLVDDSDLAKNRINYVRKHLYTIDGKAGERIVNIIEKLIGKEGDGSI